MLSISIVITFSLGKYVSFGAGFVKTLTKVCPSSGTIITQKTPNVLPGYKMGMQNVFKFALK